MDAGCEWECYLSDVTRTFPISEKGWASIETAKIYGVVEEMQERCIEQLRPGIAYMDLFVLAHRIVVEGLLRLGIFEQGTDIDLLMKKGFSEAFFPARGGASNRPRSPRCKPTTASKPRGRGKQTASLARPQRRAHPNKVPRFLPLVSQLLPWNLLETIPNVSFPPTRNMALTVEPGLCKLPQAPLTHQSKSPLTFQALLYSPLTS